MKLFVSLIFCILLFLQIEPNLAQTRSVSGKVINAVTGNPISEVKIEILGASASTLSDSQGEYTLTISDTIEPIKFADFTGLNVVEIKTISENNIDIYLSETDFLFLSMGELMNIKVVTASKTEQKINDAPAIITVVSQEDIQMYASRDLSDILDRVVGTFIYGSYYLPNNMISIRGEVTSHYCTHILILLNGRSMRSSKEGYYLPILRAFPIENIERIEVLRGPGSALYGSGAYAGIVNIITKQVSEQTTTASLQYGSFGSGMAQLATGFEKKAFNITVAGYYSDSKGWDYKVRGALNNTLYDPTNTPAIETSKGINLLARYKNFTLNTYAGTNLQMIGQISQKWWYADEWYLNTSKVFTDLGYTHKFGPKLTTNLNVTNNFSKYRQPYDVQANDIREWGVFSDYVFEITNIYKASETFSATLGGLANAQTGYILNTETISDSIPYNVWTQPKNPDPHYVVPRYNEIWWSMYANATYKPFHFLSLTAGAHANKVTNQPLDVVPRLGAIVNFNRSFAVKLLYGEAFRSADFFELYADVNGIFGNKDLKPEKIKTYDVQISYTRERFNITATYFNSSQRNVILRSSTNDSLKIAYGLSQPVFINSGGLNSQGFELDGKINVTNNLKVFFSTLFQENEDLDKQKNIYGLPNTFVKMGLQYSFEEMITVGLFNMWVSKGNEFNVPFPDANPQATSFDYLTAKVSANLKKLFKLEDLPNMLFELFGVNLLDEGIYYTEYDTKLVNTIPGRSGIAVYGGLKIKF